MRNSKLDPNDYFNRAGNRPRPAFRRNQFGGAAGGPIIKDRTFIFGDYEGFRQGKGIPISDVVPSDDARLGILHNADGTPTCGPLSVPSVACQSGPCPTTSWTQSNGT